MSNAKDIGEKIHMDIEATSLIKGNWSARYPQIMSIPRGHGKSVLQGMDFGKLEQTAVAVAAKNKGKLTVSSPTIRAEHAIQKEIYAAMLANMQQNLSGSSPSWLWGDAIYTPPVSKLQAEVHKIIDDFWDLRCCSLGELYLKQKERNSKTKDLFKSKSTTHHYPWYKRGSSY